MEFKHNKKRNIGLISEFFSRYIAEAFIDGRHGDIAIARKLWQKHVHPKSTMHEEFQIFNALHESSLRSREVAYSVLDRARQICKKQSQQKLDDEKNALITEVNATLKDKAFFDRSVPEYKAYASVQVLLNAWRGIGFKGSLSEMAQLEESIMEHMLTSKEKPSLEVSTVTSSEVNSLVVKLMTEKFNEKYNGLLNETQKSIVKLYALTSNSQNDKEHLSSLLESIRHDTLKLMKSPFLSEGIERSVKNKLSDIVSLLENQYSNLNEITDETITFYMSVAKLKEELESKV